jgi:glutamine cyclotransferase
MSDGTSMLRFLDPQTYRVVRRLQVHSRGRRVDNLNELEYVNGEVLANVWGEDYIVRIAPTSGEVTGWIDLRRLWPDRRDPEAVLNGIAYDAQQKRLFVTGKNWPKLYQIRVVPR